MVCGGGGVVAVKVALTEVLALARIVHAPVPEQPPPLQLLKVEPELAVAVSVTVEPFV